MRQFQLGEKKIRLWWSYPEGSAVTLCHLQINDEEQHNGYALCSSSDKFDKDKGRKLSLKRALLMAGFDKNERRFVWNVYHTRFDGFVGPNEDILFLLTYLTDTELRHLNYNDAMALAMERDKHSANSLVMSMES